MMGNDLILTLAIGFLLGSGLTGLLWAIDRWRSRPIITESDHG